MIVTHTSPDWDALSGVWLLQRYGGLADDSVTFVNTGNPDPALLEQARAVVDTGGVYDPAQLRFDHHQLPGAEAGATCATRQVYDYLRQADQAPASLLPLIDLVTAGDTGQAGHGAYWSRRVGLHAMLSALKARKLSNEELLDQGFHLLDLLAESLSVRAAASAMLAQSMIYTSEDGLFVALKDAPPMATGAAFESGARVVMFRSSYDVEGGTTHAIGLMRAGEWREPHLGQLVGLVQDLATLAGNAAVAAELASWYRHEAGFFAGRGTTKAPVFAPVAPEIDLVALARAFDLAWLRGDAVEAGHVDD